MHAEGSSETQESAGVHPMGVDQTDGNILLSGDFAAEE